MTIEEQVSRAFAGYRRAGIHARQQFLTPSVTQEHVDKHVYLSSLQDRNEVLFYRLLCENFQEMAPIVYTPVVGYACQQYGELWRRSRGMWINGYKDKGDMHGILNNWKSDDPDVIVITDGSRILGLGDLGAYGMGIPIGKLITYVAGSGIHPNRVLPMYIDVGTDNHSLHEDPLYLGEKKPRMGETDYLAVWDELMDAITYKWPNAIIQFEDIKSPMAEKLLARYREFNTCFNDDIQGTGSMVAGGILAALRLKGKQPEDIREERIVVVGAGSAGIGICNAIASAMGYEGIPQDQARSRFLLMDKVGLVTEKRTDVLPVPLKGFARKTASDNEFLKSDAGKNDLQHGCNFNLEDGASLLEVVKNVKPTILLGVSGVGGVFTREILTEMNDALTALDQRPVVFALSNPTDKSECTAEQAYDFTNGNVIFASGSPFPAVIRDGKEVMLSAQSNNIFIYPGVGLGVTAVKATTITEEMFYAASKALAETVPEEDLLQGRLFPPLKNIREISHRVAVAVAEQAIAQGVAQETLPAYKESWEEYIEDLMWKPEYQTLISTTME